MCSHMTIMALYPEPNKPSSNLPKLFLQAYNSLLAHHVSCTAIMLVIQRLVYNKCTGIWLGIDAHVRKITNNDIVDTHLCEILGPLSSGQ
jgi:hypothetical protein